MYRLRNCIVRALRKKIASYANNIAGFFTKIWTFVLSSFLHPFLFMVLEVLVVRLGLLFFQF